jgi:hypothetical protein
MTKNLKVLRSPLFVAALHAAIFCITLLTAFLQTRPMLDGPARWGVNILFITDLPVSVVGFSLMWDRRFALGLSLWGVFGTAWWYVLALCFNWLAGKRATTR